jgi:tetratricopeptide (TPR) repeat protein
MKKLLPIALFAFTVALLTSCTTITVDAPQPAELSLGRGSRVSIVPEAGSDCGELAHALFQLFAGQGYYQLVDRANLGDAINERNFQRMSFVENRTSGRIKGVDAFIYLQAEGMSGAQSDSSSYTNKEGETFRSYTTKTIANYIANYRAVMTSSSQIAGGRRIELSDSRSAWSNEGYPAAPDPYPLIAGMRNKAASQIFTSLHPSVLKIRRVIGGTKSVSAKQAIRLANAGLWAEATAAAEQGVQELPADPEARYILAIVYQGTGRYADTDKVLRQLVGMSPNGKYANAIRENQAVWQNAKRFQQQM